MSSQGHREAAKRVAIANDVSFNTTILRHPSPSCNPRPIDGAEGGFVSSGNDYMFFRFDACLIVMHAGWEEISPTGMPCRALRKRSLKRDLNRSLLRARRILPAAHKHQKPPSIPRKTITNSAGGHSRRMRGKQHSAKKKKSHWKRG